MPDKDTIPNGVGSALIIGKPVGTYSMVLNTLGVYQADDPDLGDNRPGDLESGKI